MTAVLDAGQIREVLLRFLHIENVAALATFSDCGRYRYKLVLTKTDVKPGKSVCVIMQNPSIASSDVADRSVQFLEKLVFLKGYTQFNGVSKITIVNQFAYVQTNDFDGGVEHVGPKNDSHIRDAIADSDIVLVAWGSTNGYQQRKAAINEIIAEFKGKLLLRTKAHPSRGTYVDFIEPYSI